MSEQIIGRLDEMGKRVDDLEKNIGDLVQQVDSKDDSMNQVAHPQHNSNPNK
jgi:heat shock factor-binding protein 1